MNRAFQKSTMLAAILLLSVQVRAEDAVADTSDCVGIPFASMGYFDSSRDFPFKESQVAGVKFAGAGPGSYSAVYLAFPASGSDYDLGDVRDVVVAKADDADASAPMCQQDATGGSRCHLNLPNGKLAVSVGFYGELAGNVEIYQLKTLMAGKYAATATNCNAQGRHFDFAEFQKRRLPAQQP